ncbi:hypothetical protein D3C84_1288510 [compost metagenome]
MLVNLHGAFRDVQHSSDRRIAVALQDQLCDVSLRLGKLPLEDVHERILRSRISVFRAGIKIAVP